MEVGEAIEIIELQLVLLNVYHGSLSTVGESDKMPVRRTPTQKDELPIILLLK